MRRKLLKQLGLVTISTDHVRARELAMMSRVLDELPRAVDLVHGDLVSASGKCDTGRDAMTSEQVLRAMVIKQRFGCSYDALAFQLIGRLGRFRRSTSSKRRSVNFRRSSFFSEVPWITYAPARHGGRHRRGHRLENSRSPQGPIGRAAYRAGACPLRCRRAGRTRVVSGASGSTCAFESAQLDRLGRFRRSTSSKRRSKLVGLVDFDDQLRPRDVR